MESFDKDFSQTVFGRPATRILICVLFIGTIADAVVENRLLKTRLTFQKMYAVSGRASYLIVLVAYEILKIVFDFFLDTLQAVFRYRFEIKADDLFLQNLLSLRHELVSTKMSDKHIARYNIRRNALINLYINAICIVPRFSLHLLTVLYCTYSCKNDKVNALMPVVFVVLLVSYICCFLASSVFRKNIRSEYNRALVKKTHYAGRSFSNIDVIKAYCSEDAEVSGYLRLLGPYFHYEYIYHLVSEIFRFMMRLIILVPQIAIVMSIQYKLEYLKPDAAYQLFFWIKSINQSMLQLRNCLAMYFEYVNELQPQDEKHSASVGGDANGYAVVNTQETVSSAEMPLSPTENDFKCLSASSHKERFFPFAMNIRVENINFCLGRPRRTADAGTKPRIKLTSIEPAVNKQGFSANSSKQPTPCNSLIQTSCGYSPTVKFPDFTIYSCCANGIFSSNTDNKSLIFEALLGIRDYKGTIQFGAANARLIPLETRFAAISYLPCEQELFDKSVMFNLSYGTGKSREQIFNQLDEMGLCSFFKGLHGDLDTDVGKENLGLSSGQRQMICVCRALLKDSPVYLLDNPTVFLDEAHKKKVFELIFGMRNKTVVVITPEKSVLSRFGNVISI